MVTTAGFNALLKIVEEPPEHLIFVFATTEPEKVLPTIRSRTHHYPFRLLAPRDHARLCWSGSARQEDVAVDDTVYPLVIRAGGGSPRDTLSVLDQLLAGADGNRVAYPRALALLGATDVALIDDAVDALAAGDAAALFGAVESVIDAGHDPRRFATDLLERFRDLIVLQAVPDAAARGVVDAPGDVLERMREQAARIGAGDADALRRGGARRPRRDARGHRAAAAARSGVRAAAAAVGQRHRIRAAATGRAHRDPAGHVDPRRRDDCRLPRRHSRLRSRPSPRSQYGPQDESARARAETAAAGHARTRRPTPGTPSRAGTGRAAAPRHPLPCNRAGRPVVDSPRRRDRRRARRRGGPQAVDDGAREGA